MNKSFPTYIEFINEATSILNIEVITQKPNVHKITINGVLWSKPKVDRSDIGQKLLNLLFYENKNGDHKIKVVIDGVDETEDFKKDVIEKYKDTGLSHYIDLLGK
jgi:hypothetical protein